MAKKTWSDLTPTQKRAVVAVGAVETALTLAAWRDLASRPAGRVRGPKKAWSVAVMLQPVGPLAYFALGRR